jgi:putative membrane protein
MQTRALNKVKALLPHDKRGTTIALNISAGAVLFTGIAVIIATRMWGKKFKSSEDFVRKAAAAGTFEIEASRFVLNHTDNDDVREFAETMIEEHEEINDESYKVLSKSGISDVEIKEGLDSTYRKMFDKLNKALDNRLDIVYIEAQKKAHAEAVKLFSDYAKCGDDPALKDFAARVLPTLKHHQEMAENLTIH